MVDAKSILRLIAVSTATVAAGAVGGPVAAAEVAAFMASPPGRKLTDAVTVSYTHLTLPTKRIV